MTVPIQDPIVSYTGNGVATQYTVPFRILQAEDLTVELAGDVTTSYSLSGIGDDEATVTFQTAPALGASILMYRKVALERTTDYQFNGDLRADTVNADFDRVWMALQDSGSSSTRSIQYPIEEYTVDGTLPPAAERASNVLAFDVDGNQTLVPLPSSLGAGDLRFELGSDGTPGFKTGADFTPNSTTQLTLSRAPISRANCWVYWDGTPQLDFDLDNQKLIFPTPIPDYVSVVNVRIGTVLSLNQPAQQSVTDDAIAPHSKVWNRINGGILDIRDTAALGAPYDDTAAFVSALATGRKVYVPSGNWNVSDTLTENNGHLFGDGQNSTFIRMISTARNKPIFRVGALSSISDLFIGYSNNDGSSIVDNTEVKGERIAFDVGGGVYPMQRGGGLRRLKIGECGTAVFNSDSISPNQSTFNASFEDIECQNFSFAGFWMGAPVRTGNLYRNLYLNAAKWAQVKYGFYTQGEESETTIDQLNIESMKCEQPVVISGMRAANIGTIHFEEVILANNSSGLLIFDRSAGKIAALTAYYCDVKTTDWAVVKLGSAQYDGGLKNPYSCNYLRIEQLHTKGLNQGNSGSPTGLTGVAGFYFVSRPSLAETPGTFNVQIDHHVWNTFAADDAVYTAFPRDPQNSINFIHTAAGPV